jgi:hypothetical protein
VQRLQIERSDRAAEVDPLMAEWERLEKAQQAAVS